MKALLLRYRWWITISFVILEASNCTVHLPWRGFWGEHLLICPSLRWHLAESITALREGWRGLGGVAGRGCGKGHVGTVAEAGPLAALALSRWSGRGRRERPSGEGDTGGVAGALGHLLRAGRPQDAGAGRRADENVWRAGLWTGRGLGERGELWWLQDHLLQAEIHPSCCRGAQPRLGLRPPAVRALTVQCAWAPHAGRAAWVRQHWYAHTVGSVSQLPQFLGLLHSYMLGWRALRWKPAGRSAQVGSWGLQLEKSRAWRELRGGAKSTTMWGVWWGLREVPVEIWGMTWWKSETGTLLT